jgi:hypothetical protein
MLDCASFQIAKKEYQKPMVCALKEEFLKLELMQIGLGELEEALP